MRAPVRGVRGLQKAILQPFQGGRYLQKAPRSRCVAISGGMGPASRRHLARDAPGAPEGSQELFYSHSRRAGAPRRLPEAVLQPFQGGRGPQKAPRNGFTTFPGGYEGPRRLPGAVLQAFPGVGAPRRFPGAVLQPFFTAIPGAIPGG